MMLEINKLAYFFGQEVRAELTPEEFKEVLELNATPDYTAACATHDFRDVNMLMFDAFTKAFGKEPMMTYSEDFNEEKYILEINLWNAAWDQAKNNNFKY